MLDSRQFEGKVLTFEIPQPNPEHTFCDMNCYGKGVRINFYYLSVDDVARINATLQAIMDDKFKIRKHVEDETEAVPGL